MDPWPQSIPNVAPQVASVQLENAEEVTEEYHHLFFGDSVAPKVASVIPKVVSVTTGDIFIAEVTVADTNIKVDVTNIALRLHILILFWKICLTQN